MQINLVVRQHEANTLMLAERLAKGMPPPSVLDRDRVTAFGRAEPTHTMRETRRAEPHLRVSKALADLAKHAVGRHAHVVERGFRVPARRVAVNGVEHAVDAKAWRV